ncbi:hypothetical protein HPB49_008831 [Dermacentor silvarum]|uniref:Uncharacterized protein n=1 Tax=Dermacentor silvarum TaxID=543639 RepID=A0ACB8DY92_DERSI|nr:hypothetical protein HPB49_008831 [Dermacentor silvarum]
MYMAFGFNAEHHGDDNRDSLPEGWVFPFSWEPHVFVHPPRRRRTKPSSPVVRPPTALAESRRRVASVFTMDVQVAGQDISPEEVTAQSGWLTARSRRSKRGTDNSTVTDESSQAPSNRPRSRARQPVKAQVLKVGRMPPLPTEYIKIVIRPKGALHIAKIGSPVVTAAILQAVKLTDEESLEDTLCPNTQQKHCCHRYARISSIQVNGVTHEVNAYETAAEHTTKGVIPGIPLTETLQQIHNKIVTARNPTALAAKRLASTTTVIIAFDGPDVPFQKQIDNCYQCGRLGHHMGVCPYPNNKICWGCGARNPPADHNCNPRCSLCGRPHLTADKSCAARYKTPNQSNHLSTSRPLHPQHQNQVTFPNNVKGEPFPLENSIAIQATTLKIPVCIGITHRIYQQKQDNPEIAHLKRENAILRDLLTKLMQEVRDLKQSQTPAPTPIAQNALPLVKRPLQLPPPRRVPCKMEPRARSALKLKTCSPHFKQLGTAEAFTRNNRYLINTYANIPAARMLSYFKKPIAPPPRSLVIKPFIPPTIFTGSPP